MQSDIRLFPYAMGDGIIAAMRTFKVMQFNMQFGQTWDESDPDHAPIDLDLTISEISKHDADIIMLQEVEHAACGVEIGAGVDGPARDLLGRGVHRRAQHDAELGRAVRGAHDARRAIADNFRDAKVQDLGDARLARRREL